MAEAKTPSGVRHKTFTYRTSLAWVGDRAGVAASPGKPSFRVSSPPEFKGEDGVWTPEDLLIAAAEVCMMTTFLAFASRARLRISSYSSEAAGTLEFADGVYRVTRIVLRPTIVVEDETALSGVEQTLAEAHQACIVSNSIRTDVTVEPLVRLVTETVPVA